MRPGHRVRIRGRVLALLAIPALSACADAGITDADLPASAALALLPGSSCASDPDFVVQDRDAFLTALTTAPPGSTIAIDGMIEVDFDGNVETAGLTFDCATPGSGLLAAAQPDGIWLFIVKAPGVTVRNLVLDASQSVGGAYLSDKNGVDAFAEGLAFVGNTVRCASTECVFVQSPGFAFAAGAVVANNHVESTGDGMGIHIQGYEDVLVRANTVNALVHGNRAILVNGARGVRVEQNVTGGNWTRAISMIDGVFDSRIEGNDFEGGNLQSIALVATQGIEVVGNAVACGTQFCLVAQGGSDLLIEGNDFVANGPQGGILAYAGFARGRIVRNRLVTSTPSTDQALGAIRVRTGSSHVIEGNELRGPWAHGVSVRDVSDSRVADNRAFGSGGLGVLLLQVRGTEVVGNLVSSPTGRGILLDLGCYNAFLGNNVERAAGSPTVAFARLTGANRYAGNPGSVTDLGQFDCDGDGVVDPNDLMGG